KNGSIMRPIAIPLFLFCVAFLSPRASAVTATYTNSSQNVTLTGLGGTGGVGQSRVDWGACAYDGTNTNCTVSAPYTGVGGGGTISFFMIPMPYAPESPPRAPSDKWGLRRMLRLRERFSAHLMPRL